MGADAGGQKGVPGSRADIGRSRGPSCLQDLLRPTAPHLPGPAVAPPLWALLRPGFPGTRFIPDFTAHTAISCSISPSLPQKATCPKLPRAGASYLLHTSLLG